MKRNLALIRIAEWQVGLTAALAWGIWSRQLPRGVAGEWEWKRVDSPPGLLDIVPAVLVVVAYAALAAGLSRWLRARESKRRKVAAVCVLFVAGLATQTLAPIGAPYAYGPAKSPLVVYYPSISGYYTFGKKIDDPWRFLAEYPEWIKKQDSMHIGTHPPGLFLSERLLLGFFQAHDGAARLVIRLTPDPPRQGLNMIRRFDPLPLADGALLIATAAAAIFCSVAAIFPLYLLVRATHGPAAAWSAAAIWPLVPASILFQPVSDIAFPLLSTTALACAAWSSRRDRGGRTLAALAGVVLAVGMQFTLAFLPVGVIVAGMYVLEPGRAWRRRALLIAAVGAGFLVVTLAVWAVTAANPFAIWWANQANHARFYHEYPKTYWRWVLENPFELAASVGIPAAVWMIFGLRGGPRVAWLTLAMLAFLTIGGRSLSEVARLWILFYPALLAAAGAGMERLRAGPWSLAITIALQGLQVVALQALIQVSMNF